MDATAAEPHERFHLPLFCLYYISHNAFVLCLEVGSSLPSHLQSLETVSPLMLEVHRNGVGHNFLQPASEVGECSDPLLLGPVQK